MSSSDYIHGSISFKTRRSRELMWVHSLHDLRDSVSEGLRPVVNDGVAFLENDVVPAEPIVSEDGKRYGVRHETGKIGFVALFHADAILHDYFKTWINDKTYSYREDLESIMVPPQRLTNRWRGILLFHELLHAKYHKAGTFRDQPDAHYIEEQSVYRDELKIVQDLYGQPYEDFLQEGAEALLNEEHEGFIMRKALGDITNTAINTILSDTPYKHELNFRRGAVMMHLGYNALELLGLADDESRARFTRSTEKDRQPLIWLGNDSGKYS